MRRIRRVTAALTSLLMIHLGIVSGAMACPLGEAPPIAGATMPEHGSPMMTGHHHPGESTASNHGDAPAKRAMHHQAHDGSHCGMPCTPAGCASMAHCGPSAFRGTAAETRAAFSLAADPQRGDATILHSISAAPEPPPPRG